MDASFGMGGVATYAGGFIVLLSDGTFISVDDSGALRHYSRSGAADGTFGTSGVASPLSGLGIVVEQVMVDANDNILIVGSDSFGHFLLARVTSNGALDTGSGSGHFGEVISGSHIR